MQRGDLRPLNAGTRAVTETDPLVYNSSWRY
jgi:hypothetical protein